VEGISETREEIFHLIETADNFVKYADIGKEERAAERARERYQEAADLAVRADDAYMIEQVKLRIADLERRAALPRTEPPDTDDPETVVTQLPEHAADRVPPGQRVTKRWPVLHEGPIPRFDRSTWRLTVSGACAKEVVLSYDELRARPAVTMHSDFHCVTGWTKLDNDWTGIKTRPLIEMAEPNNDAGFVSVAAEYGYTANVPLEFLLADDAILAWGHNGQDLAPKHGYPLRLVLPRVYGWKSVKWVRSFELLTDDRRGFWEVRGYHNAADPWREERYSYQE
jgi:DMSO/TMAO reductase YedYZ molybdopterin-dependent catalytic subunit